MKIKNFHKSSAHLRNKIISIIKEDIAVKDALLMTQVSAIEALARMMMAVIKSGNKILVFGNGGSAADSIHIVAELVGRFRRERKAIPAIALTSNISALTALGNDYGFENIFERQIEALGKKGDMALGISTSGRSENVIRGIIKASRMKLKTAVLAGKSKGRLTEAADISIMVPSANTPRIQEAHITIAHIVCEITEDGIR